MRAPRAEPGDGAAAAAAAGGRGGGSDTAALVASSATAAVRGDVSSAGATAATSRKDADTSPHSDGRRGPGMARGAERGGGGMVAGRADVCGEGGEAAAVAVRSPSLAALSFSLLPARQQRRRRFIQQPPRARGTAHALAGE